MERGGGEALCFHPAAARCTAGRAAAATAAAAGSAWRGATPSAAQRQAFCACQGVAQLRGDRPQHGSTPREPSGPAAAQCRHATDGDGKGSGRAPAPAACASSGLLFPKVDCCVIASRHHALPTCGPCVQLYRRCETVAPSVPATLAASPACWPWQSLAWPLLMPLACVSLSGRLPAWVPT